MIIPALGAPESAELENRIVELLEEGTRSIVEIGQVLDISKAFVSEVRNRWLSRKETAEPRKVHLQLAPMMPADSFKCDHYRCTLTARVCVLRQSTILEWKGGNQHSGQFTKRYIPLALKFCSSGDCAQGKAVACAVAGQTIEPPKRIDAAAAARARAKSLSQLSIAARSPGAGASGDRGATEEEDHGAAAAEAEHRTDRALPEPRQPGRDAQERAEGGDHHAGDRRSADGDRRPAGGPLRPEPDRPLLRPARLVQLRRIAGDLEVAAPRLSKRGLPPAELEELETLGALRMLKGRQIDQPSVAEIAAAVEWSRSKSPPPQVRVARRRRRIRKRDELHAVRRTLAQFLRAMTRELARLRERERRP